MFPCRVSWGRWWASWRNTSVTWTKSSSTPTNQSSPPSSWRRWTSEPNTVGSVSRFCFMKQSSVVYVHGPDKVCCVQGDLETTAAIEGCVIDCLLAMVMKLSEVTFRPLFFKVTLSACQLTDGADVVVSRWLQRWCSCCCCCLSCSCSTGVNLTVTSVCWRSTDWPTASPNASKDSSSCSQETWWNRSLTCFDRPTAPRRVRLLFYFILVLFT